MKERAPAHPPAVTHSSAVTGQAVDTVKALDGALRRLMWEERIWLKQALREYDLEIPPFMVLTHLIQLGGNTTMGALAKQLDQRNTTMTGHIDRLESKGLVTRKFGIAEDRRQVTVHLMPKGKTIVQGIMAARQEHVRRACAHLSEPEIQHFVNLVEAYLDTAENEK